MSVFRLRDRLYYGWVLVFTFLAIGTVVYGVRYSFGVFFKPLEGEFELTRAATSSIFSVYLALCAVFAILGGLMIDRYGPRALTYFIGAFACLSLILTGQVSSPWQLYVSYSFLLAVGTGSTYVMIMSTTSRWFVKKRGLAMGIASCGAGLGTVVMAPLATQLITNFGWRMSYVVLGIIAGVVIISLAALVKRDPRQVGALPDGALSSADRVVANEESRIQPVGLSFVEAIRTGSFWLFCFTRLAHSFSLHLILVHLVPHITDMGFSRMQAATVFSLMGGISILGRLAMGRVADSIGKRKAAIITVLPQVGAFIGLIWARELGMLYLFAVVYGFAYGGLDPTATALASETFGLRRIGAILGSIAVSWGLGAAFGPALGGYIYDATGSYSPAFLIAGIAMALAIVFLSLIRRQGDSAVAG
ncbi:MFS transporter [Chloroflexota bacterium]